MPDPMRDSVTWDVTRCLVISKCSLCLSIFLQNRVKFQVFLSTVHNGIELNPQLDDSLLEDPYQTMPVSASSSTCCAPEDAGCFGEQSEKARLTDPKGMFLTPEELSVDPGTKCTFQVSIR